MVTFVCVNAGNYLGRGADYVNILFNSIARNLPDKHKYVCFTDTPEGINPEIEIRALPGDLKGWWNKLYLFKRGLFNENERIIYFDLDTVIVGALDDIIKYRGDFAILRDFYRSDDSKLNCLQSSVMAWRADSYASIIWFEYERAGQPQDLEGGDQEFIEKSYPLHNTDILQELYPQSFVSYKTHCRDIFPKSSKVVCFHGQPRPHEVTDGWVPRVWKLDGGTALEMTQVMNVSDSDLIENIKSALKLPYPRVNQIPAHDGHAVIVGGGPSLNDHIDEIRWRKQQGQIVFATNNTLSKVEADYHVMLDARKENAAFVPYNMKCLYASQCHPNVFERSKNNGNAITIWHSMIDGIQEVVCEDSCFIGAGLSSVGLKAMALAYTMGYRKIHIYGLDSSYRDGEHHAYKQPLNDNERILDVECNGTIYTTAAWMATQAEEFKSIAGLLVNAGCTLTVHGDGLIPDIARNMVFGLPAAQLRANAILSRLPEGAITGAEIGVFTGDLSQRLLSRDNLTLYMVDSWATSAPDSEYAKSEDFHASLTESEQEGFYLHTVGAAKTYGDKAKIIRKFSIEAMC